MNIRNCLIGVAIGIVMVVLMRHTQMPRRSIAAGSDGERSFPVEATPTALTMPTAQPTSPAVSKEDATFEFAPRRLRELLRESIQPASVITPTSQQRYHFKRLMLLTLQQNRSWDELSAAWNEHGWRLERWKTDQGRFVAVCERSDQRHGRGVYVIRPGSRSGIALQAPHRFYDTDSGTIVRKLMDEHEIAAAAWNTVHRREVDIAHQRDHFINAFTEALLEYQSSLVVAQLHGFANDQQDGRADNVSLIVSDATRYPARVARAAATELKAAFSPTAVRLYPEEITVLGGTRNEQARVFHNRGSDGFLHLEINRLLREKLVSDASVRTQFFSALTTSVTNRRESLSR